MAEILHLDDIKGKDVKVAVNYWQKDSDIMSKYITERSRYRASTFIRTDIRNLNKRSGNFELLFKTPNVMEKVEVQWRLVK